MAWGAELAGTSGGLCRRRWVAARVWMRLAGGQGWVRHSMRLPGRLQGAWDGAFRA